MQGARREIPGMWLVSDCRCNLRLAHLGTLKALVSNEVGAKNSHLCEVRCRPPSSALLPRTLNHCCIARKDDKADSWICCTCFTSHKKFEM